MKNSSKIAIAASLAFGLCAVASADPQHRSQPQSQRGVVVQGHVLVQQHQAPGNRHGSGPGYRNAPVYQQAPVYQRAPVYRSGPVYQQGTGYRYTRADERRFSRYHRGDRMPVANRGYVVNDWRSQRLAAPPRGHQWVQDGRNSRDFALVAIATGVIASIVLSNN